MMALLFILFMMSIHVYIYILYCNDGNSVMYHNNGT